MPRFAVPRPFLAALAGLLLLPGAARAEPCDDLARQIADLYRTDPGVTAPQRATDRIEADRRLLDLERQEEALIRSAERAGFDVMRRADADPRAVLSSDEVLP